MGSPSTLWLQTDAAAAHAPVVDSAPTAGDRFLAHPSSEPVEPPFSALGELAFAGRLRVAPSPGENAVPASAAESGRNQDPVANSPADLPAANAAPAGAAGQVIAIPEGEDDGGAGRQARSDDASDQDGNVPLEKKGGADFPAIDGGRWPPPEARAEDGDEAAWDGGSRAPAAAFRAADGFAGGSPSSGQEAGAAAPAAGHSTQGLPAEPDPAPPNPARDITLRLTGGDQRVAVRLVERQGEVRVEVRTPDAGLAGDLRRDLPSLAERLEQSGFRAGTWQAGPEWRRPSGSASPAADQDSNAGQGRRHGREGRDDQPGRSPEAEEQIDRKGERREFEWFLSSHR
jgi:hypothetical protein